MSGAVDECAVMRFCRWADGEPDAARDVAVVMATFRVSRRVACRWRRAHRESQRHAVATVRPRAASVGRHDLRLDQLHGGESDYVAASLRHAARCSR